MIRLRPRLPYAAFRAAPLLSAALLAAPTSARAQSATEVTAITDRVFADVNGTHGPGCGVGIARGGRTLLERGYGMADLANGRPITPATILESGSVAKQFTAASIMALVADGKLKLDDDVRTYIPELPSYGRTMTVRHLLTHTSGLREWSNLVQWQGWPRGTRAHTQSDAFHLITSQRAVNYPIGDHYSYTNSGFLLLRTIIERVSGQSYMDFTRDRLFRPVGMTNTQWRDDYTRLVPGLAQAYRRAADGWHLDMPNDNVVAAGGMLTTVSDWLRWNQALTTKVLGAAIVDSMTRQMRLTNGLEIQYALGLIVSRYRGTKQIAHSGSTGGYSTYLARFPELSDLSVAVLCNFAGANATAYTYAIVDALAPQLAKPATPDTVALNLDAARPWLGIYEHDWYHTTTRFDTAGGQLRLGTTRVRALADGSFQAGTQRFRLAVDANGMRTIRQATTDGDSLAWTKRAERSWTPTAAELAPFAGRYRSDEVGTTFTVSVRDGKLILSPRVGIEDVLTPTYRDAFDGTDAVWFTRDAKRRITAMHFGSSRAWDFVLTRVP